MVKLVRLTTTDQQAIFDNNFNTEILIEPKSQVALKSLTLERVRDVITINESNREIDFNIGGTQQKAFLTEEIYDPELINDAPNRLLRNMTEKFNEYSKWSINTRGVEAKVDEKHGKVNIEFQQGILNENQSDWIANPKTPATIERTTQGSDYFYGADVSGTLPAGQIDFYQTKYLSKGVAQMSFELGQVGTSTDNLWFVGFSLTDPANAGRLLDLPDIRYGLYLPTQNGAPTNYQLIENGATAGATGRNPNFVSATSDQNDTITITKEYDDSDQVVFKVTITQSGIDYSFTSALLSQEVDVKIYPVIIFLGGKENALVRNLKTTISPFNPNHTNPTPTKGIEGFIQFQGDSLRKYLRYDTLRLPPVGTNTGFPINFKAEKTYKPNNQADAFIVEFLNLPLTAWDGLVETRQPYLNVIPIQVGAGDLLIYDTPFPIFIDIDNSQPLGLRNLKVRILNNDLSPFEMTGLASMTLLFKDKNE
jgi:hypothetical protein